MRVVRSRHSVRKAAAPVNGFDPLCDRDSPAAAARIQLPFPIPVGAGIVGRAGSLAQGERELGNYVSRIFGTSPVAPIQEHVAVCYKAVKQLVPLFESAIAERWDQVAEVRETIVAFENEADDLKKQIRAHLPKSLFMPVPRGDLLDLLLVQDGLANRTREISGLVVGRHLHIPGPIQKDFMIYVGRNIDAAKVARKSIRELDELFETGFRGAEAQLVVSMVEELDRIEKEADDMQVRVRSGLFAIEDDLPPVNVMFLYRIIELVGEVGNTAERLGRRLEVLLSH